MSKIIFYFNSSLIIFKNYFNVKIVKPSSPINSNIFFQSIDKIGYSHYTDLLNSTYYIDKDKETNETPLIYSNNNSIISETRIDNSEFSNLNDKSSLIKSIITIKRTYILISCISFTIFISMFTYKVIRKCDKSSIKFPIFKKRNLKRTDNLTNKLVSNFESCTSIGKLFREETV